MAVVRPRGWSELQKTKTAFSELETQISIRPVQRFPHPHNRMRDMASEAAAEAIRYDRKIWYPLVCRLLQTFIEDGTEDRDSLYLESIQRRENLSELSLHQAKWVLDIKFRRTIIGRYKGISVSTMVKECFESIHLLVDEFLIERIQKLYKARVETLRGAQAVRLYKVWINLEPDF